MSPWRRPGAGAGPLRVGIIGFGTAGRVFHSPFLAADPRFSIAAIVTGDPERRRHAAAAAPGARVCDSADDLLRLADAGELDLVVVASPPGTHAAFARRAIEAGVAVLVDKPFCTSAREGRALIEAAARDGVPLTVFQNRRWDGDFRTVRALLDDGALGAVHRFESRFEWWKPTVAGGWKDRTPVREGGGILYDLGTHLIDQALTLFGEPAAVHAEVATRRTGGAAGDDVFVSLEHGGGVVSHLWMSSVAAQRGPRFRVLGSESAYTTWGLDPQEDALKAGASPQDPGFGALEEVRWGTAGVDPDAVRLPTLPGAYAEFYRLLGDALLDGGPLPVDSRDAVRVLEIIEGIHLGTTTRVSVSV